ncbi:MAG: hypothetical protein QW372_06205 [Nitrososphaerales archaeon]
MKRLGLKYEQVARGKRNSIESWFRQGEGEAQGILQLPSLEHPYRQ